MDKILHDMGMQNFIQVCKQKQITIKTFEYIMSPESTQLSRKIVTQDTGLTSSQIIDICGYIEKAKKSGKILYQRPFPKSKHLTNTFGRSNRIQKLVGHQLPKKSVTNWEPQVHMTTQQQVSHNSNTEKLVQPGQISNIQENISIEQIQDFKPIEIPMEKYEEEESPEQMVSQQQK